MAAGAEINSVPVKKSVFSEVTVINALGMKAYSVNYALVLVVALHFFTIAITSYFLPELKETNSPLQNTIEKEMKTKKMALLSPERIDL